MCKLDDWFNNGLPVADRLEEKRGHVSIIHGDILARLANCRMPDQIDKIPLDDWLIRRTEGDRSSTFVLDFVLITILSFRENELREWNKRIRYESYFIVHVFFAPGYIVRSGSLIVEAAAIHLNLNPILNQIVNRSRTVLSALRFLSLFLILLTFPFF